MFSLKSLFSWISVCTTIFILQFYPLELLISYKYLKILTCLFKSQKLGSVAISIFSTFFLFLFFILLPLPNQVDLFFTKQNKQTKNLFLVETANCNFYEGRRVVFSGFYSRNRLRNRQAGHIHIFIFHHVCMPHMPEQFIHDRKIVQFIQRKICVLA